VLCHALRVDDRLDAGRLPVTRAAGELVERRDELRGRLVEATARRGVHRDALLGGLRVAEELLLRLLARSLETLRLARARRRGAVGQRRANLVTAVARDRPGIRLHARAASGLVERGGELREHLVLARRQERRIALLRNLRLAGEESGFLLRDRLQAKA